MKQHTVFIAFLLSALCSTGQIYYQGLERMCWTNEHGKTECYDSPRKWYHLNTIMIDQDSIYLYMVPVRLEKKDTLYSASDGAFYYYYGPIKKSDSFYVAYLTSHNCDYCGVRVRVDSATGFYYPISRLDTLQFVKNGNSLKINNTVYKLLNTEKYFPDKQSFYFDSNSISRRNPKGQYKLIAQGVKNFLQTNQLKLDNDTLRLCTERFAFFDHTSLIENLNADSFYIDTTKIHFQFLTRNQLQMKSKRENKILRYIEVKEIIDYWKAARVEMAYRIILPKSLHNFSDREYFNAFEYKKTSDRYELIGNLPDNGWGLVEQK